MRFYYAVMRRLSVDNPGPALRQLPTLFAFVVALTLAILIPPGLITGRESVFGACAVMILASGLAAYYSRVARRTRWALLVPGLSLLAIALFRDGTGGPQSYFSGLIILPIVWLASERGRRWIIVAILGTSAALMFPYIIRWTVPETASEWLRGVFTPFVFGLAAAVINELSRQARQRVRAIASLASERASALEASQSIAKQLADNETRLREADRLTRSVLDAVTEQSIIGTDLTGLIDVWNPGAAAMLGLSATQTQGIRYVYEFHEVGELADWAKELGYPAGATVLTPGFSALVESARQGRAEVRDWTYVREDGSPVSVSVAVTPRLSETGKAVGYIFVATDVTQALEVSRLKDEFVGLISHELRTPLSSILGYLELMRDDEESPLSEEQVQYLDVADRNARRLLSLVGDLLFTAQVASGKFPLDLASVQLGEVVTNSVESARPVATTAGVELVLIVPKSTVTVQGDGIRLGQACDNLISNAVKFTPRGGTVTVSLAATDASALVTVQDTGMGIPADELDQLYARFFRASTATRNAVPGVGLGLTITKAIVTAHNGELDVSSEEGVGTAFLMSIPLEQA